MWVPMRIWMRMCMNVRVSRLYAWCMCMNVRVSRLYAWCM